MCLNSKQRNMNNVQRPERPSVRTHRTVVIYVTVVGMCYRTNTSFTGLYLKLQFNGFHLLNKQEISVKL